VLADEPVTPARPIQPSADVRGSNLDGELNGLVESARSAARLGLGFEAVTILVRIAASDPESAGAKSAIAHLKMWGVEALPAMDSNREAIDRRVAESIQEEERVLVELARLKGFLELRDFDAAAELFLAVARRQPRGAAVAAWKAFTGNFALEPDARVALSTKSKDEIKETLARAATMAGRDDLARFLRAVEPKAGDVFTGLLVKRHPEAVQRVRPEENDSPFGGMRRFGGGRGGFRFGGPPGPGFGGPPPGGGPGFNPFGRGPGGGRGGGRGGFGPGDMVRQFEDRLRAGENPRGFFGGGPLGEAQPAEEGQKAEAEVINASQPSVEAVKDAITLLASRDPLSASELALLASEALDMPFDSPAIPAPVSEKRESDAKGGKQKASDALFEEETVQSYALEIPTESIDALRKKPKDYVKATFRAGELTFENVGVKLRGSIGTYRELAGLNKSAFTVKFNAFVEGQKFRGQRKIILNNGLQTGAFVSEFLAFGLFRDADLPAPRVTFANLAVNGKPFGLFIQLEAVTSSFLKRWFSDAEGSLYEGPGDIIRWEDLDLDSPEDKADRKKLAGLAEAAEKAAEDGQLEALSKLVDLDRLARYIVLEQLLNHWDGYFNGNNYRIYFEPTAGYFSLIPHGVDQTFTQAQANLFQPGETVLTRAILATPEGRKRAAAQLKWLLETVWDPTALRAKASKLFHQRLRPEIEADARRQQTVLEIEERFARIVRFFTERRRVAQWQLAALDDPKLAERLEAWRASRGGGGSPFQFFGGNGGGPGPGRGPR
jgi:hypothetical protein